MPLYDYACTKCGRTQEVRHGFNETHSAPCPACGAPLRRVFNAAPVLFKGSGFYVTDSRKPSSAAKTDAAAKTTSDGPAKEAASTPESPAKGEVASTSENKPEPKKSSESAA